MVKDVFNRFYNFVKKHMYDENEGFWNWKLPPTGKKHGYSYGQVLKACRASQYFVAVIALLLTLSFQYSRQLFVNVAVREGLLMLILELVPFLVLGYCLGIKRLPANYISLTIMKFFVVLEKQIKPNVRDFQVKVLGESRYQGQWSALAYNPRPGEIPFGTEIRNVGLMALSLMAFWTIDKFTDIDLTQYERSVLVTTTAGTASAALILVSSFGFETFPEFKEKHKSICEVWMILGVTAYIFVLLYLFQRLQKSVYGKLRPLQGTRLMWESALYTFALYIMLCYVPVIHKGVSTKALLQNNKKLVGEAIVPGIFSRFCKLIAAYLYGVGEAAAKLYGSLDIEYQYQSHQAA